MEFLLNFRMSSPPVEDFLVTVLCLFFYRKQAVIEEETRLVFQT